MNRSGGLQRSEAGGGGPYQSIRQRRILIVPRVSHYSALMPREPLAHREGLLAQLSRLLILAELAQNFR
jgi:hypothetical protein